MVTLITIYLTAGVVLCIQKHALRIILKTPLWRNNMSVSHNLLKIAVMHAISLVLLPIIFLLTFFLMIYSHWTKNSHDRNFAARYIALG